MGKEWVKGQLEYWNPTKDSQTPRLQIPANGHLLFVLKAAEPCGLPERCAHDLLRASVSSMVTGQIRFPPHRKQLL